MDQRRDKSRVLVSGCEKVDITHAQKQPVPLVKIILSDEDRKGNPGGSDRRTMQTIGRIVKCFVAREKDIMYDYNKRPCSVSLFHPFFFLVIEFRSLISPCIINREVNAPDRIAKRQNYSLTPRRVQHG